MHWEAKALTLRLTDPSLLSPTCFFSVRSNLPRSAGFSECFAIGMFPMTLAIWGSASPLCNMAGVAMARPAPPQRLSATRESPHLQCVGGHVRFTLHGWRSLEGRLLSGH